MAYIEKEKLMELSQDITTFDYQTKSFGCFSGVSDDDIAKIPTADVVKVVRCKDCKHSNDDGTVCRYSVGRAVEPEHFCSYGTPKERGGEK